MQNDLTYQPDTGAAQTGFDATFRHAVRHYLHAHDASMPPRGMHPRFIAMLEAPLLEEVLSYCQGNQCKAAAMLGMNRNTLHKKLRLYGLIQIRPARRPSLRRRRAHG